LAGIFKKTRGNLGGIVENCIFCAIAAKESPAELEYENDEMVAFGDIDPKAPVHILIVPKKHISSVATLTEDDVLLVSKMILAAKKLAKTKILPRTVIAWFLMPAGIPAKLLTTFICIYWAVKFSDPLRKFSFS